MKLIEADKVKQAIKDYWKAQVDKALTLTFTDGNEADKRINSYLEHNHELLKAIDEFPSAQPEQHLDEWCVDCKEYDKEKHSCPRWNRVIRQTLLDAQPERKTGRWIKTARWGRVYYCDQCRNYLDFDGVNAGRGSTNFCPNCGADMRGE